MPKWQTPPAVAETLGVDPEKVIGWIRRGELRAVNVAESLGGRPRYRIDPDDLERFLANRSAGPAPKVVRRKRATGVIRFFCWGAIMALVILRPVDQERREILAKASDDIASLAAQVRNTQSSVLSAGQDTALKILISAAKNARQALQRE